MRRSIALFMPAFLATALLLNSCIPDDAPDQKDTIDFVATLDGTQEVPGTNSPGKGTFTGTYNKKTKELEYSISYSGLSGAAVAGHFHEAPSGPGTNGPVRINLASLGTSITGSATFTQPQENALIEQRMYVNLHTALFPTGEIRGNIYRKNRIVKN